MQITGSTNFARMIQPIFSTKFTLFIIIVFLISSGLTYVLVSVENQSAPVEENVLIDKALGLSLNGYYDEAFQILSPLQQQGNIRAKLYTGVAYYHGHGVTRDLEKSRQLFLELQEKNYEPGIVNTYLNLIGSIL